MHPTTHALFVTPWLPTEAEWTRTAGIARRQSILVDALKQLSIPIEVLVYVSEKRYDGSASAASRIQQELGEFWGVDARVTVCCWGSDAPSMSAWGHYAKPALNYLDHRYFKKFAGARQIDALARALARGPSTVLFHRLQSIMPLLAGKLRASAAVMDLDDVEHVSFRHAIHEPPMWLGKYLDYLQIPAMMIAERRAVRTTRSSIVCSDKDRLRLQRQLGLTNLHTIANAVASHEAGPPASAKRLLLLGHYSFTPNRLGADYLIEQVWPLIVGRLPDAELIVAGAGAEQIRSHSNAPHGVRFPGYVDQLDPMYRECRAVVCPILSGSGTRVKVMEAAAYGRPIVSTTLGAEGIDLEDGSEILLADSPQAFAAACIRLLTDHALAVEMGQRAQIKIESTHGRERTVARLAELLRGA